MERRSFIASTGIALALGATSNIRATTSIYNKLSSDASLAEFSESSKKTLESYIKDLELGLEGFDNKNQLIRNTALPAYIVKKSTANGNEEIIYKNREGQYIKIHHKNGRNIIAISFDRPK